MIAEATSTAMGCAIFDGWKLRARRLRRLLRGKRVLGNTNQEITIMGASHKPTTHLYHAYSTIDRWDVKQAHSAKRSQAPPIRSSVPLLTSYRQPRCGGMGCADQDPKCIVRWQRITGRERGGEQLNVLAGPIVTRRENEVGKIVNAIDWGRAQARGRVQVRGRGKRGQASSRRTGRRKGKCWRIRAWTSRKRRFRRKHSGRKHI